MKPKIFVDGQYGTTGLQIYERLSGRTDLEVLEIDPEKRKDPEVRRAMLNQADIVFLCLPDDAAKEAVSLITSSKTRVIDASTAHRTAEGWVYGLPELNKGQRDMIKSSMRVSNPGCHATGFITLLYPLIQKGVVPADYPVACTSLTGYSGGGKKLIEIFNESKLPAINSPKPYALGLRHKHLPEMQKITGLLYPPLFMPVVGNFYKGMAVSIPLLPRLLSKKVLAADVHQILADHYSSERFVKVMPFESDIYLDGGYFNVEACNDTNRLEIFVFGHDDQILLTARFDNLGKGASGAAVQNMNIMLGLDEGTGLAE